MNKSELIDNIAASANLSKAASGRAVDAITRAIAHAVASGDQVTLVGFGTFKPVKRAERTGKNPLTGATLKIPAATVPKFSAGSAFKAKVAKGKR